MSVVRVVLQYLFSGVVIATEDSSEVLTFSAGSRFRYWHLIVHNQKQEMSNRGNCVTVSNAAELVLCSILHALPYSMCKNRSKTDCYLLFFCWKHGLSAENTYFCYVSYIFLVTQIDFLSPCFSFTKLNVQCFFYLFIFYYYYHYFISFYFWTKLRDSFG